MLKIAVPHKGRLTQDAIDILRRAGIQAPYDSERTLAVTVNSGRYQILYSRARDIPEFIEVGAADVGMTGLDLVEESGCRVEKLLDLPFGHCKLVVAAPENSEITSIDEIPKRAKVATVFPNLTRRYFEKKKKLVTLVPISGAAEIAPSIGVADLITDLTQTGATLKQNHLSLIDVVMSSWAVLIGGEKALRRKKQELEDLIHALQSVQNASRKRYLMANAPKEKLREITKLIPGLSGPTVMQLAASALVAVHAVIDENDINELIPRLKKAGASGILVLPIERLVP